LIGCVGLLNCVLSFEQKQRGQSPTAVEVLPKPTKQVKQRPRFNVAFAFSVGF